MLDVKDDRDNVVVGQCTGIAKAGDEYYMTGYNESLDTLTRGNVYLVNGSKYRYKGESPGIGGGYLVFTKS